MAARNPDLYAGAARYYAQGRMAYPAELADRLTEALGLDGTGRLLDVGCGPGSLTLLLADRFESAVGVDADAAMVAESTPPPTAASRPSRNSATPSRRMRSSMTSPTASSPAIADRSTRPRCRRRSRASRRPERTRVPG